MASRGRGRGAADAGPLDQVHLLAIEVLQNGIIMNFSRCTPRRIAPGAKPLDELTGLDKGFILFNRLCVPLLTLSMFCFAWTHPEHVEWDLSKATPLNTLGSLAALFAVYDVVYAPYHRLLHVRALYPLVHAHHHRQRACVGPLS